MTRLTFLSILALVGAGLACSGGDDDGDGNVDAGVGDAGMIRDGGPVAPPNQNVNITGTAYRLDAYLEGARVAVPGASIRTLGVVGVPNVTSAADGKYTVNVPQNGAVILTAIKADFVQTYEQIAVANQDITGKNFLLPSNVHIDRLAERFGVDNWKDPIACHEPNLGQQCKYSLVLGRVLDDGTEGNGTPTPLGGVAKDDFAFAGNGDADWYVKGPYFFFFNGQPNPNVTETQRQRNAMTNVYEGGLFMYFVEVPIGGPDSIDVEIGASSYAGGATTRYFGPTTVKVYRDSFSWIRVLETGIAPPPPDDPPPPPPVDSDFDTQIYPLFAPVQEGGFGCLGCHTSEAGATPAGGMDFYGGPAQAYTALDPANYPQRVNTANPGQSLLLTKPLYEADGNQNHPIFAFVNNLDPAYQLILGWIQGGGLRVGGPPLPKVSFYNEVRPILYNDALNGGAGCYACHVDGVDAATAPGGAYFGGDGNALHDVLTNQAPTDNGATGEPYRINKVGETGNSLVLTNPTQGGLEPHPANIFFGAADPRYQLIYRWIAEGYENDTP